MPASSARTAPELGSPPAELYLHSWPLRDEGFSAWPLLLGAFGLAAAVGYMTHSLVSGFASLAVLGLALWRLWLPIRYHVGPRGISQTVLGRQWRIGWSQIARYEVRRRGVLLLATPEPTPLRVLQARYIPWGRKRKELLEAVEYYLDRK